MCCEKITIFLIVFLLSLSLLSNKTRANLNDRTLDVDIRASFDEHNSDILFNINNPVYGSNINVNFNDVPSGYKFAFWIVDGIVREDLEESDNSFVVTNNLNVVKVYHPIKEHAVVFVDHNNKLIETKYTKNKIVNEPVELPNKIGYFHANEKWLSTYGSTNLNNISSNSIFKLQYVKDTDNEIRINVEDVNTYTLLYSYNEVVTITTENDDFTHWEEDGKIVSYNKDYTFSAIVDRNLVAKNDGAKNEDILLTLGNDTKIRNGYISRVGQIYLPSTYTLLEHGYLVNEDMTINLTLDEERSIIVKSSSLNEETNEYLTSINKKYVNIRAYAIAKKSNGEIIKIYSEENAPYFTISKPLLDQGRWGHIEVTNNTDVDISLKGHRLVFADTSEAENSLGTYYKPINMTGGIYIYQDYIVPANETVILWTVLGNAWDVTNTILSEKTSAKDFLFEDQGGNLSIQAFRDRFAFKLKGDEIIYPIRNQNILFNNTYYYKKDSGLGTPIKKADTINWTSSRSDIANRGFQLQKIDMGKKHYNDLNKGPANSSYYKYKMDVVNREEDLYVNKKLDKTKMIKYGQPRESINALYGTKMFYDKNNNFLGYATQGEIDLFNVYKLENNETLYDDFIKAVTIPISTYEIPELNSEESYTVYINIDGFPKYYYDEALKKNIVPNLQSLGAEGVFYNNLQTLTPSVTNPVQAMIISGATSEKTKNVYRYYDKKNKVVVQQGGENAAETIYDVVVKNNISVANVRHFPGLEVLSRTNLNKLYIDVESGKLANSANRFDQAIKLVKGEKFKNGTREQQLNKVPRFLVVYTDDLDSIGHNTGTVYDTYQQAKTETERMNNVLNELKILDKKIGELVKAYKDRGIYDKTSFFITTDHGMTPFGAPTDGDSSNKYSKTKWTDLRDKLKSIDSSFNFEYLGPEEKPKSQTTVVGVGAGLQMPITFLSNKTNLELRNIAKELEKENYIHEVLTREDLLSRGFWSGANVDLLVVPSERYHFHDRDYFMFKGNYYVRGQHDSTLQTSSNIYGIAFGGKIKNNIVVNDETFVHSFGVAMAESMGLTLKDSNANRLDIFK